jgi:hypothetical protein
MGAGEEVTVGSSAVDVGEVGEPAPPAAITVAATIVEIAPSEGVPVGVQEIATIIINSKQKVNIEAYFFMSHLSFYNSTISLSIEN